MKVGKGALAGALDRPDPAIRFYLFHGPDESQSKAHGERLLKGLEAEKSAISAQSAKSDPAILADEAGAIGLFGGKRAIWIEPAGDEVTPAVEALLDAPAVQSPVIAIAGALRKTSSLVKLAEAHAQALAQISYQPDQRDAERIVGEIAAAEGLRLGPGVAARIAAVASNDRGIIAQELMKIALYLGATPDTPSEVDREVLDAVGAGGEGDWTRLVDLALSGNIAALAAELEHIPASAEAITIIRALQRRLLMLAPIRARVERGGRPHDAVTSAGKSVFWKEKDLITKLVGLWDSPSLARVAERSGQLERRLMRPDSPPATQAIEEELVAIARIAHRR
ncbi:MAG TPA: DNA polymerase III subunit delta [Sphingomicrobium sp.]|nr:DNA polymerase III subunit delta [Sphingomicrobium sp.]